MDTFEYLKDLPLTDEQKQKVTEEGYETAAAFYMFCKAIPTAIKEFLGLASLDELEKALWEKLSDEERAEIEKELQEL